MTTTRVADMKNQILFEQAHAYARRYALDMEAQRVYPDDDAIAALKAFDEPLPETPSDPLATLDKLQQTGAPATVAQTGGRYFGFVNGGILPIGLATRWITDAWDQNTAHYVMSPVAAKLEGVCENWLADLFHLPPGTVAGFVTGTTIANFTGLAAARQRLLDELGWDVTAKGLYGAPPIRVLVGAGAHAAIRKTLRLLGMGDTHTEVVPTDDQGRMRIDALPSLNGPTLVVTQAGNVNSGSFDPTGLICDIVHRHGGWVHVDGAFGLWAAASNRQKALYQGTEKADSWAVDAHKTLNAPYDCGIVLCRDSKALQAALSASATYFQWSDDRDPMRFTPDMSKRARAVELWAILKTLGRAGVGELVDRLCRHARTFAEKLSREGFHIRNEVVFNQVLVSCDEDTLTTHTLKHVQKSGEIWCGGSIWNGESVIRLSVCSHATTDHDVDQGVAALVKAREVARQAMSPHDALPQKRPSK